MLKCNKECFVWRMLHLLLVCIFIYLCLYFYASGHLGAIRGNAVYKEAVQDFQVVESKFVRQDQFVSASHSLKQDRSQKKDSVTEVPATNEIIAAASRAPNLTQPKNHSLVIENDDNTLLGTFKSRILSNLTLPLLTLFTSWNENPEKHLVHNLTLINWRSLHPYVIPVVFTNESSVINECSKAGVTALPLSTVAADGIPVLKYMFRDAMDHFNTSFYAFSNGEILFTDTLIHTLAQIINSTAVYLSKPVLIVGHRTNVNNVMFEEGSYWENITRISRSRGELFGDWAEDYFITTPSYPWNKVAEVVIGRRAYDNWLVYNARKMNYTVIDATNTLLAVHQTTNAGNFEGPNHSNSYYNHDLLVKMYNSIPYEAGDLGCIEMFTQYDLKQFQVKARKVPAYCSV